MDVQQVLHMNGGEGETSYFKNSSFQKGVILKVKHILKESMKEFCHSSLPECLKVADLGCSSGPNALLPLWEMIETIDTTCQRLKQKPPQMQVFLNDLPGNDFNTLFKTLPSFYEKLEMEKSGKFGSCFIAAMPGSFHGRLFPDNSIHFVHSSFSLHFLSQVPEGLESESGTALNKGNFCVAKTSPPSVRKAYLDQFERDFIRFLRSRSQEMVSGGRMFQIIMGRTDEMDDVSCRHNYETWELMGMTLNDMVAEGLVPESLLDSFNLPVFMASAEEIRRLIDREGSFEIAQFETLPVSWDANIEDGNKDLVFDKYERGKYAANVMRAAMEPLLLSHLGKAIIDELVQRFSIKAVDYLEIGTGVICNLVISMIKK